MKMKCAIAVLAAILLFSAFVHAEYGVEDRGTWPRSWPGELEGLRKQASTFEGPRIPSLHFAIPFTDRDAFEAAWPHLLKVKTPGAPLVLKRGPSFWLHQTGNAGICVHTPPASQRPVADAKNANGNWERTIYLELIVDGDIVDLNRIAIPPETPIIDERFKADPAMP